MFQTTMGISFLSHLLLLLLLSALQTPTFALKKPYIVYMGSPAYGANPTTADFDRTTYSHYSLLGTALGSTELAEQSIFYSYTRGINGFAALLEDDDIKSVSYHPSVISVFPSKGCKLQTTRSWEFMNLERHGSTPSMSLWKKARYGEDTIIANIDSGVWPESKSFSDEGLGPIPSKWRGICQHNSTDGFRCNRKLIGARFFNKGYAAHSGNASVFNSVRDYLGHGTHTLSTAGGSFVPGAQVYGQGKGTAKGGSPRARVVAYRACGPAIGDVVCFIEDVLAAYDAAIGDGVDVISISLTSPPTDFFEDGIAIGSFHAVQSGITVVASAGNAGPLPGTVSNISPWLITVGASTIDRDFSNVVSLGPNKHFTGKSFSTAALPEERFYPVIRAADAKLPNGSSAEADLCKPGTLDPEVVSGKILICLRGGNSRVEKGKNAAEAGAVGMVLINDKVSANDIIPDPHVLPASHLTYKDGQQLYALIRSNKAPMAYITRVQTELGIKPSPIVAGFSSRGPNTIEEGILKPDITAPGVNIIAAFPGARSSSNQPFEKHHTDFVLMSGTSMSCPHVSGVVGLLKTLYPHWSPSAIKSAIMTTARTRDNNNQTILDESFKKASPFDYGSGHVRPNRAMDPGLVYDISVHDYINFLCAQGYNRSQIALFTNERHVCPQGVGVADLNYPSITIPDLGHKGIVVNRRVKNVGPPGTYTARVRTPMGVSVRVSPGVLKFDKAGEDKAFKVIMRPDVAAKKPSGYVFGELVWSDGAGHVVRSPITVKRI